MQTFAVGSLVAYMKESLESDPLLFDVWLTGEVAQLSRSTAGHVYFVLKDERAQLRCVMFRLDTPRGGDLVQAGAQVLAHGRVSIYPERGDLQFVCDAIQPEGIGAREAEFRRLRDKLEAEGLFDEARKRPLPAFPRRIGVATSPAGAVWHDITTVISRRWPLVELLLAPTPVQGDNAVAGILGALQQLNEIVDLDVLILARGGGSAEELWPFNDERVARAVYASAVPVISAVGHETDYTLVDYTADRRAPTPSAAAELVTPDRAELASRVARFAASAGGVLAATVERRQADTARTVQRLERTAPDIAGERRRIDSLATTAQSAIIRLVSNARLSLLSLQERNVALSPLGTLARGYAIVRDRAGTVLRSVSEAHPGSAILVRLADGEFAAEVSA